MDHRSEKQSRIQRMIVENIASPNFYKPVSEKNNVFCRIKKNSSVLSRKNNLQEKELLIHRSRILNEELLEEQVSKEQKKNSLESNGLKRYHSFSLSSNKKSNKSFIISSTLPQIRQSKQILLPSPKNSSIFKQKRNLSQSEIQGTRIGVLSSTQILKKYETKKLKQQLEKKLFLDNYIKNIKMQDYEIDYDSQNQKNQKKNDKKITLLGKSGRFSKRYQLPQKKEIDLSQSQQKLTELLGNRLTDRDFIDFNVKLFEKRDINKKKYFQRYHNILKKQRQEIL